MAWLTDTSAFAFFMLDIVLGGAAAWAAGRAVARGWKSVVVVIAYMVLLGLAVRFCHLALQWESTIELSEWVVSGGWSALLYYWVVDSAVLSVIAALAHRITRTGQMVSQYPWLYRRTSPISWSKKEA